LALSQASAKFNFQFEAISKKLTANQRLFPEYTGKTVRVSLESVGNKIQEDIILATARPDLQWAAPLATDAEIREALTPLNAAVHTPALVMPSVVLPRPKKLASVSEEFWLRIDPDVTAVSRKLFEDGHFAQAVFEAVKRFDNEVRERSISCGKGALFGVALMKEAFSPERPVISVAECSTTTGQNIQKGMMYLSMGLMSRIRNPLGHENVTMPLEEAKVWIGLVSQLMKDLNRAPPVVSIWDSLFVKPRIRSWVPVDIWL
jgi:uncharacterized protein (TIGR02391 family)